MNKIIQPNKPNAPIPKFRISLSIQEMDAILNSLSKDHENILENAALLGWIQKQKRKAEFGIMESSHSSSRASGEVGGNPGAKIQALVEASQEKFAKDCFARYKEGSIELNETEILEALKYKMYNPLECGNLNPEEEAVLNEALLKGIQ